MPTELITPKTSINQDAGESGQPFLVLLLRQCHVSRVNIATSVDVHAEVRTCYRFIILPLHQRHIGGVDIGACIHVGRQHTGSDGNVEPLFDPFDPKGFGVKGNAKFTVQVSQGADGKPNVVFGAWGDGKFFLDFTSKQGKARPQVQAQGSVFLGLQGVF